MDFVEKRNSGTLSWSGLYMEAQWWVSELPLENESLSSTVLLFLHSFLKFFSLLSFKCRQCIHTVRKMMDADSFPPSPSLLLWTTRNILIHVLVESIHIHREVDRLKYSSHSLLSTRTGRWEKQAERVERWEREMSGFRTERTFPTHNLSSCTHIFSHNLWSLTQTVRWSSFSPFPLIIIRFDPAKRGEGTAKWLYGSLYFIQNPLKANDWLRGSRLSSLIVFGGHPVDGERFGTRPVGPAAVGDYWIHRTEPWTRRRSDFISIFILLSLLSPSLCVSLFKQWLFMVLFIGSYILIAV